MSNNNNNNKIVDFVVVKKRDAEKYSGGVGYRGPELKALGFPVGPYSKAGAKTLVRQVRSINPKLRLVVIEYIERENYGRY